MIENGVDISDLSAMIDYLYITFTPLCCTAEANCDGLPGVVSPIFRRLLIFIYKLHTAGAMPIKC